jgi:acyl carrier protein
MDNAEVDRLVREVARTTRENPSVQTRAPLDDNVASWDSLYQMKAFIALEEKFGIEFAPEEIVPPKNMEHLIDLVRKKLKPAPIRPSS